MWEWKGILPYSGAENSSGFDCETLLVEEEPLFSMQIFGGVSP